MNKFLRCAAAPWRAKRVFIKESEDFVEIAEPWQWQPLTRGRYSRAATQ
jgi:hypothetical protein